MGVSNRNHFGDSCFGNARLVFSGQVRSGRAGAIAGAAAGALARGFFTAALRLARASLTIRPTSSGVTDLDFADRVFGSGESFVGFDTFTRGCRTGFFRSTF